MSEPASVTNPPDASATCSVPVMAMRNLTAGSLRDSKMVVAEDVNWQVEAGEFWAIAGLHGSGKSDFLMLAAGLMAPLRGSYEFMGERMPIFSEERLSHRLQLGLVFDGGRLLNHLTVAENIALPLQYHRNLSSAEVEPALGALLELTGISFLARKRPSELGRNWQQRAALARALALKPKVLLLDSPLSGLDQRQQNWWLGFLSQMSRGHAFYEGRPATVVVTTDAPRDWRGRANRFALLSDRRFEVIGRRADVEQSDNPLVQELFSPAGTAAGS